jgi:signal transduction histidine kinase
MKKKGLRTRLFLSHLLVMIAATMAMLAISRMSGLRFFASQLQQIQIQELDLNRVQNKLIKGFDIAWNHGTRWSLLVGTSAAGGFSYLAARHIVKPLKQMEQITQKFALGQIQERMPDYDIPEFQQLSISFNRMANSLQDVEIRRRELVTDLSHELRTPLTIVRGYLEELADGRISPSQEVYHTLALETKRLERLVNDLQQLSQAEAGYLPIRLKPLNLYPLLQSLVNKFADQLLEDGPIMLLNCPPNLPTVLADEDRTEQVLVNLIGNAMRYTNKGWITIKSWSENNYVWVAVIDTGIGISTEDLPHIFERFWRSPCSRVCPGAGTGIGLSIARQLIELQGGKIEVESQLNKGSIFRFSLPIFTSLNDL